MGNAPATTVRDLLDGRFLDELAARGGLIPDRRRDGDFTMLCPLDTHAERTPSCHLSRRYDDQDHEVWMVKCFGCDFQGDDISLLATLDSRPVDLWMKEYLLRNGQLDLPERPRREPLPPEPPWEPICTTDTLDSYIEACHQALLDGPASAETRRYARSRGLRGDEVRRWRIGVGLPAPTGFDRRMVGRLLFPVPGGLEARDTTGRHPKKYVNQLLTMDRKAPWGLREVSAGESPLLIVEGVLDAIACRRLLPEDEATQRVALNHNTIALRGKTLHDDDAAHLANVGFTTAHIGLDTDAPAEVLDRIAYKLLTAGIKPSIVRGPADGDWGDLLLADDEELVHRFAEAVTLA